MLRFEDTPNKKIANMFANMFGKGVRCQKAAQISACRELTSMSRQPSLSLS
jgi:hypothetical protein